VEKEFIAFHAVSPSQNLLHKGLMKQQIVDRVSTELPLWLDRATISTPNLMAAADQAQCQSFIEFKFRYLIKHAPYLLRTLA
jgi:hypothetical protein